MSFSCEDSLRRHFLCHVLSAVLILALGSMSGRAYGDCPPQGLQNYFLDVQVSANGFHPTLGMTSSGDIIVAYDGFSAGTEIMAARYHADGSALGGLFPITRTDDDPNLQADGGITKTNASLAVSGSGDVTVAFIGQIGDGHYTDGNCVNGQCPQLNCTPCYGYIDY